MFKKYSFLALIILTSCAWNPVVTPYAFKGASGHDRDSTATIWAVSDKTDIYFRKIDGKGLPSRGGGGYPISLSLLPGTYTIEVLFQNFDGRSAIFPMTVNVAAGHTYVTKYTISADNQRVGVVLEDRGMNTTCRYERYEKISGNAKLICQ